MKKWITTVAALVMMTSAFATNCCNPCLWGREDFCDGSFEVFGEALFMRAAICDLTYAIDDPTLNPVSNNAASSPTTQASTDATLDPAIRAKKNPKGKSLTEDVRDTPIGKERALCPDYDWGFRVGIGYVFGEGCNDIEVHYSRLRTTESRHSVVEPGDGVVWVTLGSPDFNPFDFVAARDGISATVDACARLEWNEVQAQLGKRKLDCCRHVRTYVGLQWTELCVRRTARFSNPETDNDVVNRIEFWDFKQDTRSWGVGPRIGGECYLDVGCGFGIGGRLGVALLAGDAHLKRFEQEGELPFEERPFNVEDTLDVHFTNRCLVFPELDARLGLHYVWCCGSCFSLIGEIGYEFRTYLNAIVQPVFYDDVHDAANNLICENFTLNGLYLRLEIVY